jgi:hypothetical protein
MSRLVLAAFATVPLLLGPPASPAQWGPQWQGYGTQFHGQYCYINPPAEVLPYAPYHERYYRNYELNQAIRTAAGGDATRATEGRARDDTAIEAPCSPLAGARRFARKFILLYAIVTVLS